MTHEEMRERTRLSFANALKDLMEEKPLDKITVKDLITRCNVNRKTFNYYFTDVYDLLQWILVRDAEKIIRQFDLISDLQDAILVTMNYIEENQYILKSAYNAVGRDMLKNFLQKSLLDVSRANVDRIAQQSGLCVSDAYKGFVSAFFCEAICGMIIDWIRNLKSMDKKQTASDMSTILLSSVPAALQNGQKAGLMVADPSGLT